MGKITKMTIIRTVLLIAGLINMALTIFGKNPLPFSDQQIADFVSLLWAVSAALWAWWKNNSFTDAAIKADEYLDLLRHGEKVRMDSEIIYDDEKLEEFEDEQISDIQPDR